VATSLLIRLLGRPVRRAADYEPVRTGWNRGNAIGKRPMVVYAERGGVPVAGHPEAVMRFDGRYLIGLGLLAGLGAVAAPAQYARTLEYLIDRPSLYGPSSAVGEIGGRYTRPQFTPLTTTRQEVALLGQEQFQFRGRRRSERRGTHIPVGALGLQRGLSRPGPLSFYAGPGQNPTSLAGLAPAMTLYLPDPSVSLAYIPSVTAHLYTPRPATTRFQELFALLPPQDEPRGPELESADKRLNARVDTRVEQALQHGLDLFKQATVESPDPRTERYANCVDCPDKLVRAVQQFQMVRIIDQKAGLPLVLMAHGVLEREQPTLAVRYLLEAWKRQPELFTAQAEPIDKYFGDTVPQGGSSAVLQNQLRRYRRIGDLNPEAPEALVLQAYCAWRLGDYGRTRETVEALEAAATTEVKVSRELVDFAAALRDATP